MTDDTAKLELPLLKEPYEDPAYPYEPDAEEDNQLMVCPSLPTIFIIITNNVISPNFLLPSVLDVWNFPTSNLFKIEIFPILLCFMFPG